MSKDQKFVSPSTNTLSLSPFFSVDSNRRFSAEIWQRCEPVHRKTQFTSALCKVEMVESSTAQIHSLRDHSPIFFFPS